MPLVDPEPPREEVNEYLIAIGILAILVVWSLVIAPAIADALLPLFGL